MPKTHAYDVSVRWTGNRGTGTSGYRDYGREHEVAGSGPTIPGSSDPAFRGDPARWNPEELLVASLAQCHLLWFLHVASDAGVIVTGYVDTPTGTLTMDDPAQPGGEAGSGRFTGVTLRPVVTVADDSMAERVAGLHKRAAELCFIARSVGFPVAHEPSVLVQT